jgi:hypothetical protein
MQHGLKDRGVTRLPPAAADGDGINSVANRMTYEILTVVLKDDCRA